MQLKFALCCAISQIFLPWTFAIAQQSPGLPATAHNSPTIKGSVDGSLAITIDRQIVVDGVPGCASVTGFQLRRAVKQDIAAPALVHLAQSTGRKIRISDPKCLGNGIIEGSAVTLQVAPVPPKDCSLPAPHGRPECGK